MALYHEYPVTIVEMIWKMLYAASFEYFELVTNVANVWKGPFKLVAMEQNETVLAITELKIYFCTPSLPVPCCTEGRQC